MLFSSALFIFVFLPISLIFYFLTPEKYKNLTLFLLSLCFYSFGEPVYIIVMLGTILADFLFGLAINKFSYYKKSILTVAITANLLSLGIFKYLPPISDAFGFLINIALPVGISFYTFQALSYVVDVYNGREAQRNFIAFGLYITMFPQLIAGPIVKYGDIEPYLKSRHVKVEDTYRGITRFIIGLSKKLLLANSAGAMWEYFSSRINSLSTLGAWVGIIFYAFQIYFDFSGYSDMAIGLGMLFGFRFPENFNYPYLAKSIKDFWSRWHISLTDWFREYVYIPLGGNRRGVARTYLNMLIVWALTGIWHGAGVSFLLWGFYYFLLLSLEKLFLSKLIKKLPTVVTHIYTLVLVLIGWVFFALTDFSDISDYLRAMFTLEAPHGNEIYHIVRNLPFLMILSLGATNIPRLAYATLIKRKSTELLFFSASTLLFFLCVANLMGASYNPFLYFRF